MSCGIYKLENMSNGKVYIGQSSNIEKRWAYHLWALSSGRHSNRHLQGAWDLCSGAFRFTVIELCSKEKLNDREEYWIRATQANRPEKGYNLTSGGDGIRGLTRTLEHRKHLSEALKGRKGPLKGKHFTEEHKKRISEALRGNANTHYGEENHAATPVICLDTGRRFGCAAEAGRFYGSKSATPGTNIRKCCLGKRPTAYGHRWSYAED